MSREKFSEELHRLLPGEEYKRIRAAIMLSYNGSAGFARQVRNEIDQQLQEPTGILNVGSIVFNSDIEADLDLWAWKINFQIVQPGPVTLAVEAPHPTFSRVDYFHGRIYTVEGESVGTIHYTPGQLDAVGNNIFPTIPEGDLILAKVQRNPDGSSEEPEIPETSPLLNFSENDIIPLARNSRLENSGIRVIRNLEGEIVSYQFPSPVRGVPATNPDEFVTLDQLPQQTQYGRLFGGDNQWSGSGLTYNISAVIYALQGIKTAPSGQITLDAAHPTLSRFDIYGWNINQELFYRAGTPSENPTIPIIDPGTEVIGTSILVPAAAATPPDVLDVIIYAEREAGEWTPSYTGSGSANFESTARPKSGPKSIEVTNMMNGSTLTLMAAAPFDFADYETIGMDLALKAQLFAGHSMVIGFINGSGQAVSNSLFLTIGNTLDYQFIGLNLNAFTQFGPTAQGISITFLRSRGATTHVGYFLDNVRLQGGVPQPDQPPSGGVSIHNLLQQIQGGNETERYHLTKSQWDAVEGANSPSDTNPFATMADVGGGGPSTGGLEDLDTFPVLKFDKNYRYSHQMIGPITISVSDLVVNQTGNYNIIYIQADGTNKPDFEETDITVTYDGWNNTVGKWNRLRFEYTPEGKAIVQIFDTAGDTNPGSGATTFNLKFDDDYTFQHVISGTVHLTVDATGAEYAKKTIFYFRADGTNKPTWAAPIEANWDNYINEPNVWNRFYLEYTPENKVTLQIINT